MDSLSTGSLFDTDDPPLAREACFRADDVSLETFFLVGMGTLPERTSPSGLEGLDGRESLF